MNTAPARSSASVFRMDERGAIAVSGDDRERWLNGMVSNDIAALTADPQQSGCYAALLTRQGRIVSDLRVLQRGDSYWLETRQDAVPGVIAALDRLLIADDVELRDASEDHDRLAVEGARSREVLEAAIGRELRIGPWCVEDAELAGRAVWIAAFGWSGEQAFQLFVPRGSGDAVAAALLEIPGATIGDAALLEVMRIEAGMPALAVELAEDTLPDEARIGHAISQTKGCYIGQEVIARLRSHGGVKHALVGLRGQGLPEPGARIERADGRRSGELTSRCVSDLAGGEIALGFVHRDDAEPGTRLRCGEVEVEVAELPFVVAHSDEAVARNEEVAARSED